jgi:hypothetical protein
MANSVDQLNGLTIAHAKLGSLANGDRRTVNNAVDDDDTVKVDPDGNVSTRFPVPVTAPRSGASAADPG